MFVDTGYEHIVLDEDNIPVISGTNHQDEIETTIKADVKLANQLRQKSNIDETFARHVAEFIETYRTALEALAR